MYGQRPGIVANVVPNRSGSDTIGHCTSNAGSGEPLTMILSMPATVRKEILDEIGTMLQAPTLPTDAEFGAQIEAWRERGFDVDPVLVLLAQHPNNFRERAVRLIRSQIRKKMEGGTFKCPLCEVYLEPAAEECGNCGAKFA